LRGQQPQLYSGPFDKATLESPFSAQDRPHADNRQQGETNLDDPGELAGEVSVKWIPNQASHDFLA